MAPLRAYEKKVPFARKAASSPASTLTLRMPSQCDIARLLSLALSRCYQLD